MCLKRAHPRVSRVMKAINPAKNLKLFVIREDVNLDDIRALRDIVSDKVYIRLMNAKTALLQLTEDIADIQEINWRDYSVANSLGPNAPIEDTAYNPFAPSPHNPFSDENQIPLPFNPNVKQEYWAPDANSTNEIDKDVDLSDVMAKPQLPVMTKEEGVKKENPWEGFYTGG